MWTFGSVRLSNARKQTAAALFVSFVCAIAPVAQASTLTSVVGSGQAFSNAAPSVALTPLIVTAGPSAELGRVSWFAGNYAPRGFALADGRSLAIASHSALYQKLGTTYGGDGELTFRLPDLRGRSAVGTSASAPLGTKTGSNTTSLDTTHLPRHTHSGPGHLKILPVGSDTPAAFNTRQPGLALNYSVATQGIYPVRDSGAPEDDMLGIVRMDASIDPFDAGTNPKADGSLQSISQNTALFSIFGTMYGGNGETTFGLPDLEDRQPVGTGQGPGLSQVRAGEKLGANKATLTQATMPTHRHTVDGNLSGPAGGNASIQNRDASLGLNYIIALQGLFPNRGLSAPNEIATGTAPFIGQIALFAGDFAPLGWAFANGQLLAVSQNDALFSILGTIYGGDGETTFVLPDLRGRTAIGAGSGPGLPSALIGQRFGAERTVLTVANLPAHAHAVIPLPAPVLLMLGGFALLVPLRRRRAI